jgi:hypothetical protein
MSHGEAQGRSRRLLPVNPIFLLPMHMYAVCHMLMTCTYIDMCYGVVHAAQHCDLFKSVWPLQYFVCVIMRHVVVWGKKVSAVLANAARLQRYMHARVPQVYDTHRSTTHV